MPTLRRVLILEENADHLELLTALLEEHLTPIDIHTVETVEDCLDFLEQTDYDLVFTGYLIHSTPITERLSDIVEQACGAPVIVISGSGDESIAAQSIKLGASDYLVKTRKTLEKMPSLLKKYLKKRKEKAVSKPTLAKSETLATNRIVREMDRLMQKARELTTDMAIKNLPADTLTLESLFSQIKRLRKMIQSQD